MEETPDALVAIAHAVAVLADEIGIVRTQLERIAEVLDPTIGHDDF